MPRKCLNQSDTFCYVCEASHRMGKWFVLSDLSWADQVNYAVKKGLESTTFHNANTKKGNSNTKCLAYMSLYVRFLNMGPRAGIRTGRVK